MARIKKLIFFFALVGAAVIISQAIVSQNLRFLYLILGLGGLAGSLYLIKRIGLFPFLCVAVFVYWLPLDSRLQSFSPALTRVYPTELVIWGLIILGLLLGSVSKKVPSIPTRGGFPFLPFTLFVIGALLAYISAEYKGEYSLIVIRTVCFLPPLFCFLCFWLIRNIKQAERLLWCFLISAGLLGLVFLYAPQLASYEQELMSASVIGSERLMKIINLPLCDSLFMGAEVTPISYAFVAILAFNLWLNDRSFGKRLAAAGIMLVAALIIIKSQGRMALIATGISTVVLAVLALKVKKHSPASFAGTLWKIGLPAFALFFGFWYYAKFSLGARAQQRVLEVLNDPSQAPGLADRIWRWQESALVALEHPFFGVGLEGFQKYGYVYTWFAHNTYLYLWLSFGIIGFIGFIWIFVRFTKAYLRALHSSDAGCQTLAFSGIACVVALSLVSITSSTFFVTPWQLFMLWTPFGITFAAVTLAKNE
ncbi:MAG: O-antigen ligase family protein [Candidatus Omnitrophica bacterium]|nr:O-antigen ligase family protein [Candidatus Omnitrophota bacterium]